MTLGTCWQARAFIGLFTLALAFGLSTAARAQSFVSPLIGFDFGGDASCPNITDCTDKKLNAGVALGAMGTFFGAEEEFAYAKNFFGDAPGLSSSVLAVMSNVMLVPNIGPVRLCQGGAREQARERAFG